MVKFESPFETIIEIFNERHPDKNAEIMLVNGMYKKPVLTVKRFSLKRAILLLALMPAQH